MKVNAMDMTFGGLKQHVRDAYWDSGGREEPSGLEWKDKSPRVDELLWMSPFSR